MNIIAKTRPKHFSDFIDTIDLDLYKYKFLRNYLMQATIGQHEIFDTSIVNFLDSSHWVLIVHGSDIISVYGENWNRNQLTEIIKDFNLSRFTNYGLSGDSEIINELLKLSKISNHTVEKRRMFYEATQLNSYALDRIKIEVGGPDDTENLAEMMQAYYQEEYNGTNNKTLDEMHARIYSLINSRNIFVLKNNENVVLSFCTIINPDIGILFTRTDYRGRGYGKALLSFCSNLLLNQNGVVYLMTDEDKPESNKVSLALGFKPYFRYIMVKINPTGN